MRERDKKDEEMWDREEIGKWRMVRKEMFREKKKGREGRD